MKINKKTVIIFIVVFIALGTVLIAFFSMSKEYVSVNEDKVYFKMSEQQLIKIKGDPLEISVNANDTPFDMYSFKENFHGIIATSNYRFYKSIFGLKLQDVVITVEDIDYKTAKLLADRCLVSFENFYSNKKGFFKDDLQSAEKSNIKLSLGVTNGATGIFCNITYEINRLTVSVIKQT